MSATSTGSKSENSIELDRTIGAYDGDRVVGGGAAFSFELTVPGGRAVKAAGVTNVGVMPTHRRRGILRQMMARQLADVRSRGEPIAILWASEGSIYQRFGYGLATLATIIRSRSATGPAVPAPPPDRRRRSRLVERDEADRDFCPRSTTSSGSDPGLLPRSASGGRHGGAGRLRRSPGAATTASSSPFTSAPGSQSRTSSIASSSNGVTLAPSRSCTIQELMAVDADAQREMWRYVFGVDLLLTSGTASGRRMSHCC